MREGWRGKKGGREGGGGKEGRKMGNKGGREGGREGECGTEGEKKGGTIAGFLHYKSNQEFTYTAVHIIPHRAIRLISGVFWVSRLACQVPRLD